MTEKTPRPVPWGTKAAQVLFTILGFSYFPVATMVARGGHDRLQALLVGDRRFLVEGDYLDSFWGPILPWAGLMVLAGVAFSIPFVSFFLFALARGRRPGPLAEGISWGVCLAAVIQAWPDPVPSMVADGRIYPSLDFWWDLYAAGFLAVLLGGVTAFIHAKIGLARRWGLSIPEEIVLVLGVLLSDHLGGWTLPAALLWNLRGEILLAVALIAGGKPLGARALAWAERLLPGDRTLDVIDGMRG